MSKIINGIKSNMEEIGQTCRIISILFAFMFLMVDGLKSSSDYWVAIGFSSAVLYALIQWDRGTYKQSTDYLLGMGVFLVLGWSLIGTNTDFKYFPVLILLYTMFFLMNLYYWAHFFVAEVRNAHQAPFRAL